MICGNMMIRKAQPLVGTLQEIRGKARDNRRFERCSRLSGWKQKKKKGSEF